jgi:hypothetical protein
MVFKSQCQLILIKHLLIIGTIEHPESILAFEDLNEGLLHRLVEVIEVKNNNEVVIHYKFMNPLSSAV